MLKRTVSYKTVLLSVSYETVLLSTHNICLGSEIRKIILSYALLSGGLNVLGKFIEMVHLNSWFIQYSCLGHCKKNSKNCFLSTADSLSQCLEQVHRIVFSQQQDLCTHTYLNVSIFFIFCASSFKCTNYGTVYIVGFQWFLKHVFLAF